MTFLAKFFVQESRDPDNRGSPLVVAAAAEATDTTVVAKKWWRSSSGCLVWQLFS